MFEERIYLSVFYCLISVNDISTNILEEQYREEKETDLDVEEDIMISGGR